MSLIEQFKRYMSRVEVKIIITALAGSFGLTTANSNLGSLMAQQLSQDEVY